MHINNSTAVKGVNYPRSSKDTSQLLEVVHLDLVGPMQMTMHNGFKYAVMFLNDHSQYALVYFLKKKSDFANAFKFYYAVAECQTGCKLKCL
ncbi:hypothetical protein AX16_009939 [Volvariella volvacea WC 439]|nr:hypothetical protein AX16_009939 [Volvariella volvacea WC 439]